MIQYGVTFYVKSVWNPQYDGQLLQCRAGNLVKLLQVQQENKIVVQKGGGLDSTKQLVLSIPPIWDPT